MPESLTKLFILAGIMAALIVIAGVLYVFAKKCKPPVKGYRYYAPGGDGKIPAGEDCLLLTGKPHAIDATKPENLGFKGECDREPEKRDISITCPYTSLEGVITFRGDNLRSGASYGTADIVKKRFAGRIWSYNSGKLESNNGRGRYWTGSGWTGQPIIIRWDDETKRIMNLYPDKKAKAGLTEVIYATMDGNVYFLDLETGEETRPKIVLGLPIKGTGSLHPAGLPIFIAGAGDSVGDKCARSFIIDLVEGKIACEYGYDDAFALREDHNRFHGYDSSPLYDVRNDIVLQPAENGIIYTVKLNSALNDGKLTLNPEVMLRYRYTNNRSNKDTYWMGMESSSVMWKNYMYIADNGGNLMCYDVNTMELIWSCDTLDDTNCSPVLEEDGDNAYIYISTSLHFTKDENNTGDIPVWKINAATGEKLWERRYRCATVAGVSGGVQATPLVGKNNLNGLVYFAIARTGGISSGKLVALDKRTGEEVWVNETSYYLWSSPLALYDKNGKGYIVQCDSNGNMMLFDGLTGILHDTVNLGKNIEASPAAFDNILVVGTRGKKIVGVKVN